MEPGSACRYRWRGSPFGPQGGQESLGHYSCGGLVATEAVQSRLRIRVKRRAPCFQDKGFRTKLLLGGALACAVWVWRRQPRSRELSADETEVEALGSRGPARRG